MTAWLKRWSALGGAALVAGLATLTAVGVNQCNRRDDSRDRQATAAGDLAMWRVGVDGKIRAADERDKESRGKLETIDRRTARLEAGQLAQTMWMRSVSAKLGVPPPPDPSSLDETIDPFCPDPTALAQLLEKSP